HYHEVAMNRMRTVRRLALVGLLPMFWASAAAAQQGTITGRITDQETGQPLASAQVVVVGTNIGAVTNVEGAYTLRGVPAGTVSVRALSIGYSARADVPWRRQCLHDGGRHEREHRGHVGPALRPASVAAA